MTARAATFSIALRALMLGVSLPVLAVAPSAFAQGEQPTAQELANQIVNEIGRAHV